MSSPRTGFLRCARHVRAVHARWTQQINPALVSAGTTSHDSAWFVLVPLVFDAGGSHGAAAQLAPATHCP